MSKITIKEFADLIRENGLPQLYGRMYDYEGGKPIGACAMGQAWINIEKKYKGVHFAQTNWYDPVWTNVIKMNDKDKLTLPQIADQLEIRFADHLNENVLRAS